MLIVITCCLRESSGRLVVKRFINCPSIGGATIFSGIQLALTYAFLGAVVGEMLSGSQGIGGYLSLQLGMFNTTAFFAALLLLVIVALVVSGLLKMIERYLLKWRAVELQGARSAHQE